MGYDFVTGEFSREDSPRRRKSRKKHQSGGHNAIIVGGRPFIAVDALNKYERKSKMQRARGSSGIARDFLTVPDNPFFEASWGVSARQAYDGAKRFAKVSKKAYRNLEDGARGARRPLGIGALAFPHLRPLGIGSWIGKIRKR